MGDEIEERDENKSETAAALLPREGRDHPFVGLLDLVKPSHCQITFQGLNSLAVDLYMGPSETWLFHQRILTQVTVWITITQDYLDNPICTL